MIQLGRCYCGEIRYELSQPVELTANCHCRNCRRANGAAFTTLTPVRTENFRLTAGHDSLTEFQTGSGSRFFCGKCGGRLFSRPDILPGLTNLLVATLDEEPTIPPSMHMNVESKAPWYQILDDSPQFPGLPPLPSDGSLGNGDGGSGT